MKTFVVILCTAFAIALAIVVGNRMSADAMAVVTGVACGVLASIPTSLLIIWATGRRDRGEEWPDERAFRSRSMTTFPPVVVVNPGNGNGQRGGFPSFPPYGFDERTQLPAGPRRFRILGEDDTNDRQAQWH